MPNFSFQLDYNFNRIENQDYESVSLECWCWVLYLLLNSATILFNGLFSKDIQIFDLDGLRCFESSKSCGNSPNLKLFKAKFLYLSILIKEISKILTAQGAVGIFF